MRIANAGAQKTASCQHFLDLNNPQYHLKKEVLEEVRAKNNLFETFFIII